MDRREALKMLGAGGALVVASPVLLPTFDVAHAASPTDTGLAGVPAAGDPLPFSAPPQGNQRRRRRITIIPDLTGVTCADGSAPIVTYEWRVVSLRWQGGRRPRWLRVVETTASRPHRAGTELIASPPVRRRFSGPTAYSPVSFASAFQIRKRSSKGRRKFKRNDRYTVEARVRWHCDGATSDVEAEYVFDGEGVATPSVANTSWNVVPA